MSLTDTAPSLSHRLCQTLLFTMETPKVHCAGGSQGSTSARDATGGEHSHAQRSGGAFRDPRHREWHRGGRSLDIEIKYPGVKRARKPGIGPVGGCKAKPAEAGTLAGPILFSVQHLTRRDPSPGPWLRKCQPKALGAIHGKSGVNLRESEAWSQLASSTRVRRTGSCKSTADPSNLPTTPFITIEVRQF